MKSEKSKGNPKEMGPPKAGFPAGKASEEINQIAEYVIEKLQGKVIIHRYDAFSTNSVYLKFDYGVANSLRISDYAGYKHLDYRFNILLDCKKCSQKTGQKYTKEYFPPKDIDLVVRKILENKELRVRRYKDYEAIVEEKKNGISECKGFWTQCWRVDKGVKA